MYEKVTFAFISYSSSSRIDWTNYIDYHGAIYIEANLFSNGCCLQVICALFIHQGSFSTHKADLAMHFTNNFFYYCCLPSYFVFTFIIDVSVSDNDELVHAQSNWANIVVML